MIVTQLEEWFTMSVKTKEKHIRIDVRREDGQVTRLDGVSGIAVACPPLDQSLEYSDPGVVSLRCDNAEQLAWNLACILSTVRYNSPEAYEKAHQLERFINSNAPQWQRHLPPRSTR